MQRIHLARACRADAADLIRANEDNAVYHAPWLAAFRDQAGFDSWFAAQITGPNVSLVAREAASGLPVGVFNLSAIVMGPFQSAFLGYYGYRETAGRGLVTEALRGVVQHAFDEVGLHRIEANIQPGNTKSIALVQRAGFRKEGFSPAYLKINGVWSDHERWAITAES